MELLSHTILWNTKRTVMEQTRLAQLLQNVYIPEQRLETLKTVPLYHPCLVVNDKQNDLKTRECGCSDTYCIKDVKWIPLHK